MVLFLLITLFLPVLVYVVRVWRYVVFSVNTPSYKSTTKQAHIESYSESYLYNFLVKMDMQDLVPSNLEEKLKCFICKNYLSYFPVSMCSNGRSLCGRCTPPADVTCYEDEAFETLCQLVKFPCRYHSEGCLEELVPKEVPEHEETCLFRKFKCVSTKPQPCNWSGDLPALLKHCQDKHSNVFLNQGEFEIDLTRSEENDYFLEHDDHLVIFTSKFDHDSKRLLCALYSNQYESVVGTFCQLSVTFGKTTILQELNLNSYEAKTFTELFLQPFCSRGENKLVLGKLCIGEKQTMNNGSCSTQFEKNENNSKILSALTCCLCRRFATPPFYRRFGAQTMGSGEGDGLNIICSKCKRDNYNNTCCKNGKLTGDIHDNKLAAILTAINCDCPYQKNGCPYGGQYEKVRTHYQLCQYVKEKCVLDSSCSWIGPVKEASGHIQAHHQEVFVPSGVETEMTSQDRDTKCKFIKVREFLFRLSYKVNVQETAYTAKEKKLFMWSVQMMGDYKEKFKYQIDVSDKERGGRVSLWQFCTPVTEQATVFMNPGQFCYFEVEQLHMLKSEDKNSLTKIQEVVVGSVDPLYYYTKQLNKDGENVLTITFKVKIYK